VAALLIAPLFFGGERSSAGECRKNRNVPVNDKSPMTIKARKTFRMLPNTKKHHWVCRTILLTTAWVLSPLAIAQEFHQPLSQHTPPGQAAAWLNYLRQYDAAWLQPMQVEVQGGGSLEVYSGSNHPVGRGPSPTIVAANAGHLYRFRVSEMTNFPEAEIYPSVELLDRLHPPEGRADDFPIPIIFTADDIQTALNGQLVTRIIYLEQPQIAQSLDPLRREIPQSLPGSENALQEADRLGRPMAVIRIGGRLPSGGSPPSFFGTGGAVQMRQPPSGAAAHSPASVQMNSPAMIRQASTQRR